MRAYLDPHELPPSRLKTLERNAAKVNPSNMSGREDKGGGQGRRRREEDIFISHSHLDYYDDDDGGLRFGREGPGMGWHSRIDGERSYG